MRYVIVALTVLSILSASAQPVVAECQAVNQTNDSLRALQVTVEAYYKDHKRYPDASSIEQLAPIVSPIYIREMPLRDGWGNPLLYRTFADGKMYVIASPGSDGAFDEKTWAKAPRTASEDAVVRSGQSAKLWGDCK